MNSLVGEPVEVILASVEGTVTVALSEVAKLLAGVLTVCVYIPSSNVLLTYHWS